MSAKPYRGPFPDVSDMRRRTMAAIRGKNTKPELAVRSLLHGLGYRFRLHKRGLPGRPDLVFPSRKKALFIHGCFWHGHTNCRLANVPKTRTEYWGPKLQANRERDRRKQRQLRELGWETVTIWECQLRKLHLVEGKLRAFLGPPGLSLSRSAEDKAGHRSR
jgi:DNA mismatch endonuclease, patch repair protein